jgi:hypothetical protein
MVVTKLGGFADFKRTGMAEWAILWIWLGLSSRTSAGSDYGERNAAGWYYPPKSVFNRQLQPCSIALNFHWLLCI